MDMREKLNAVQRMQDYIHQHLEEPITLEDICRASWYSKWHSLRMFKEITGKTPFAYIRGLQLTSAARKIKAGIHTSIFDVAVEAGFSSHEGFTKAFYRYFGVNPNQYRDHIPRRFLYCEPYSILDYYQRMQTKEYIEMAENQRIVTVTVVEKPACKLILKRGTDSTNYFEFCAEMGCDAFEYLETVSDALESVVFLELPQCMITPGTSKAAAALEVPVDYSGEIPEGFEVINLPSCMVMWFHGAPYEDESMYGVAHKELDRAIAKYKPELYGYEYAKESAPVFQYFASAAKGVRQMIPVKRRTCE